MYSKEGIISAPYNYTFVNYCNNWILEMWKVFIENEFLVTLIKVLFYLATSKLDDYEAYIEYKIKLVFKLQFQKTENISILLS